ncbi:DUF4416 family protein [Thermodesulfovibrio sp.]|uniref:DUF4416 family protein n=1 Tax=Thermodesulfovibrio sp. TaxID=2067987 RepID=UPI0030B0BD6C
MGKPAVPKKVLLFVSALYRDKEVYYNSLDSLEKIFGEILIESSPKEWNYSDYYKPEIGSPLFKRFVFFKNLISEAHIADIKLKTNQIEGKYSENCKRKINLDPGYISTAKLVLATTKDYSHRIYLKDGIYGEVTLIFKKNTFCSAINTYRDYEDLENIKLFNLARKIYKELLID